MKVYPPRDILPFIMYCVNGKPRSSLLIESTDSMTRTLFHSAALLYTWYLISTLAIYMVPYILCYIHGTLFPLLCIAIYTRTLFYSAALPYTWYLISTLLHCYIHYDLIPLCCISIGPYSTLLHCYINWDLIPLCCIAIYARTLFHSAALSYTWYLISTLVYCYINKDLIPLYYISIEPSSTSLHCYINWDLIPLCCIAIYARSLFHSAALPYTWYLISTLVYSCIH